MGKMLKNKNKNSHIATFRKEGVGLCTENLAREQYHRKEPIRDKMNGTVPRIIGKSLVVNAVIHMALLRSRSEQYFLESML